MNVAPTTSHASSRVASIVAFVAFLLIAGVTLRPYDGNPVQSVPWCLVCGESGVADVLRNVVLFIPYGAALRATGMRRALLLVLGTTVMIELMQYRVIAGREGTLSDVLTNLAGGAIGIALADRARRLLLPTRALASRLAVSSGLVVLLIMGVTLMAFRLSMPNGPVEIQWAPTRSPMVPFRGRVESVRVNGRATHRGEIIGADQLGAASSQALRVDADVALRGISSLTSAIVRGESPRGEVLFLGARERDVLFTPATRAARWRLNPIHVVLADGLPAGDDRDTGRVRLWATASRGTLAVGASTAVATRTWTVVISPALGWAMLSPFYYSLGRDAWWLSVLWLLALWIPFGYWGSWAIGAPRSSAGLRSTALCAAATASGVVLGLVVLPRVAGFQRPPWTDWLGVAIGVTGGWLAAALVRRRYAVSADSQTHRPPSGGSTLTSDTWMIATNAGRLDQREPAL